MNKNAIKKMAAIQMLRDGATQQEVAREYGVHYTTIGGWLKTYRKKGVKGLNTEMRKSKKNKNLFDAKEIKKAIEKNNDKNKQLEVLLEFAYGASNETVMEKFNISSQTISRYKENYNFLLMNTEVNYALAKIVIPKIKKVPKEVQYDIVPENMIDLDEFAKKCGVMVQTVRKWVKIKAVSVVKYKIKKEVCGTPYKFFIDIEKYPPEKMFEKTQIPNHLMTINDYAKECNTTAETIRNFERRNIIEFVEFKFGKRGEDTSYLRFFVDIEKYPPKKHNRKTQQKNKK